ncbi:MAG: hypothetical protein EOM40_16710 [Clostridia bacterium]|nr:hypothetical protein [Clostridia bacterium]
MGKVVYDTDKPQDCKYCYFWLGKRKGCERKECYYLIKEQPKSTKHKNTPGECPGCPYGRVEPCIGYCLAKIMHEMKGIHE